MSTSSHSIASIPDTDESEMLYTLEIFAQVSGVHADVIAQFVEQGLIKPLRGSGDEPLFDAECVRAVRRVEALVDRCEMNLAGLKLLMGLLDEVEQLRADLRLRR